MATTTILLCGVGGQGTILAADLLARAAMASGKECKVSEIHGMAQRGGSVTTTVVFGEDVKTMIADLGESDFVVSFETTEALRNLPYLKVKEMIFYECYKKKKEIYYKIIKHWNNTRIVINKK